MPNTKALLVIDLQNDYLWNERKPMFSYDTAALMKSVNETIHACQNDGYDIIYIAQMFQNLITNRMLIGFSIKGTKGAELYSGLDIVSDLYFEKMLPDTYTAKAFRTFMQKQGYTEIAVCGLDECGCVGATAKGAAKTGAKVSLIEKATACRFPAEKRRKMWESLEKLGVRYV
ncbi:MAG: cysteine hydrolase [Oscillospiraceae bacterium]|nr:cysteine hydrolase [Oscillospiraceae bacterium]